MDEKRKALMDKAVELGVEVSKFWNTERIALAVQQAEEKQKEIDKISLENSSNQECPSNACQELQEEWDKEVKCFNPSSKYCQACEKDFPETKAICEKRTLESPSQAKGEKKAPKSKASSRIKVGFGHVEGTQAAAIDLCLQQGMAKEDIIKSLNDSGLNRNSLSDDDLWSRVNRHFADLKECHGITITKDDGVYSGKA